MVIVHPALICSHYSGRADGRFIGLACRGWSALRSRRAAPITPDWPVTCYDRDGPRRPGRSARYRDWRFAWLQPRARGGGLGALGRVRGHVGDGCLAHWLAWADSECVGRRRRVRRGRFSAREDRQRLWFSSRLRLSAYIGATVGELGFLTGFGVCERRLAWLEDYAALNHRIGRIAGPARLEAPESAFEPVSFVIQETNASCEGRC